MSELYRPSNGSEGCWFTGKFCDNCVKCPISEEAKNQCGIMMRALAFEIEDKEYPPQWCYQDGEAVCTAFKSRADYNAERRKHGRRPAPKNNPDKDTADMFA